MAIRVRPRQAERRPGKAVRPDFGRGIQPDVRPGVRLHGRPAESPAGRAAGRAAGRPAERPAWPRPGEAEHQLCLQMV